MKNTLIDVGLTLLNKNNEFKTYTKSTYFNEINECLNNLEIMVCGIIPETWCYFDEPPKNKQELKSKIKEINSKYDKFISYRDTHKTKISSKMLEMLGEIEVELYREKQSTETLFFIKTDILDNLEKEFILQLKKR